MAESLPEDGGKMVTPFDVIGKEWVVNAARDVLDRFGQAGILINNTRLAQRSRVADADQSVCRAMMDVDFFPPVMFTKLAVYPGRIICDCSSESRVGSLHIMYGFAI